MKNELNLDSPDHSIHPATLKALLSLPGNRRLHHHRLRRCPRRRRAARNLRDDIRRDHSRTSGCYGIGKSPCGYRRRTAADFAAAVAGGEGVGAVGGWKADRGRAQYRPFDRPSNFFSRQWWSIGFVARFKRTALNQILPFRVDGLKNQWQ